MKFAHACFANNNITFSVAIEFIIIVSLCGEILILAKAQHGSRSDSINRVLDLFTQLVMIYFMNEGGKSIGNSRILFHWNAQNVDNRAFCNTASA